MNHNVDFYCYVNPRRRYLLDKLIFDNIEAKKRKKNVVGNATKSKRVWIHDKNYACRFLFFFYLSFSFFSEYLESFLVLFFFFFEQMKSNRMISNVLNIDPSLFTAAAAAVVAELTIK